MCTECGTGAEATTESVKSAQWEAQIAGNAAGQLKASNFRDRLESRRNSLTRQLTQVEQALQLLYTNPDAEKTYEVLKRTGVL